MRMTTPPCRDAGADVIARYLSGTLEAEAVEAFELHMVDCAACQRALRDGAALRKVLRTTAGARAEPRVFARRTFRWIVPLGAAAAGFALWLALPHETPLGRLGRLGVPPALGVLPVRGDADSAASLVRRGMDAYRAGRYPEAARFFAGSDSLAPSETAAFYRGVSALLGGDAATAIVVLRRVMHSADDPYSPEAHFYSAKAWLRLGRADAALAQLVAIPAGGGALATHAAALADSVRAVMR
jgi:hypothetical protein